MLLLLLYIHIAVLPTIKASKERKEKGTSRFYAMRVFKHARLFIECTNQPTNQHDGIDLISVMVYKKG